MSPAIPGTQRAAWICAFVALFLTGAWLRFHALDTLELFVDEGGHLLVPVDEDIRRVIDPIAEGKPAMLWFFRPASAFNFDPLIVGRAMVGICGLITAGSIGATLFLMFGPAAAFMGSALWVLLPFTVFHERLVLFDPIIAMWFAVGIAAIAYGSQPKIGSRQACFWTVLGSLLAGMAALQKISIVTAAPWLLIVYIAIQHHFGRDINKQKLAAAMAAFLIPTFFLWIALPELGERIFRTANPAPPYGQLPFLRWYWGYGGWPLVLLTVYAAVIAWRRRQVSVAWFGIAALLSLAITSMIYRQPYARYGHADHVPLVIFLSAAIATGRRWMASALMVLASLRWLYVDMKVISEPGAAPLPAEEIKQYVTGYWSGHGCREVVRFAEQHSPCAIFVRRYSRPGSYALILEARRNPQIIAVPLRTEIPREIELAAEIVAKKRASLDKRIPAFLLAEGGSSIEAKMPDLAQSPFRVVLNHTKPDGVSSMVMVDGEFLLSDRTTAAPLHP